MDSLQIRTLFVQTLVGDYESEEAWEAGERNPLRSLNRGRVSFSFPQIDRCRFRAKADQAIASSLCLPHEFVEGLSTFVDTIVDARLFEPNH